MGTHARRRSYGIPAVTTLGITMTGCTNVIGGWEMTRFAGLSLPIESVQDPDVPEIQYGGSGRLDVTSSRSATLTMSIHYSYDGDYGYYAYTIPLTYGVSISSISRRRYQIQVVLDDLYAILFQLNEGPVGDDFVFDPQKSMECTLNSDDALMCADQDLAAWDFIR